MRRKQRQREANELMAQLGASILRELNDSTLSRRNAYHSNLKWGMWNLRGQP